jgi:hypothetical protein
MTKINYEIDNEIAFIKMDDGKANAMDSAFFEEFSESRNLVNLLIMWKPKMQKC